MSKQRSTIGLRPFSTNAALPSAPFCIEPDTSNTWQSAWTNGVLGSVSIARSVKQPASAFEVAKL